MRFMRERERERLILNLCCYWLLGLVALFPFGFELR